jgi:NhaP-type Na+/H+ or K+/H+ antiporter
VDFVFRLHMITPPYRIAAFNLGTAATLVLVTAGIGYVMGFVVGFIWNRFGPRAA